MDELTCVSMKGKTAAITDEMIADQFRWYEPDRIILFGSHARGGPAADIDVVIIKETQDRFLDRLKHVYERWSLPVAVDILVYTPAEWDRMVEEERGFILRILQEGREIYVRPGR
jgi:predicted nucleotidyltransferase